MGDVVQVYIPTLSSTPFMPDKLCRSVEDAKRIAAEHVLAHLPIPLDGLSSALSRRYPLIRLPVTVVREVL